MHLAGVSHGTAAEPEKSLFGGGGHRVTRPATLNKHRIYTQERMHDVRLLGRVKRELQCREKAKQASLLVPV